MATQLTGSSWNNAVRSRAGHLIFLLLFFASASGRRIDVDAADVAAAFLPYPARNQRSIKTLIWGLWQSPEWCAAQLQNFTRSLIVRVRTVRTVRVPRNWQRQGYYMQLPQLLPSEMQQNVVNIQSRSSCNNSPGGRKTKFK